MALEPGGQGAHHEIGCHLGIHHQGDGLAITRTVSVVLCTVQLGGVLPCRAVHEGKRSDKQIVLTHGSAAALQCCMPPG